MTKSKEQQVTADRRSDDRRSDSDRRVADVPVVEERRTSARRKVQRRRQIDPTTCERDYSSDEVEFMQAIDAYKRANGRMFPTCSEILEVIRGLGYVKVDQTELVDAVESPEIEATTDAAESIEDDDIDDVEQC